MNKKEFDTSLHTLTLSEDGSYTAYSQEYKEHYHSTKDGALKESLYKHVIPALRLMRDKEEIYILDICYGLGFNTLATLLYIQEHYPQKRVKIFSPELDATLIASLPTFTYPEEFNVFGEIIKSLSQKNRYEDKSISIELFIGDAREYVKKFHNTFDIVYQDAFSPSTNPILWTQEYFRDIKNAMKESAVLTTYSIALKSRLALHRNGFKIYLNQGKEFRKSTLASLQKIEGFEAVDMQHKILCNPDVEPLKDGQC